MMIKSTSYIWNGFLHRSYLNRHKTFPFSHPIHTYAIAHMYVCANWMSGRNILNSKRQTRNKLWQPKKTQIKTKHEKKQNGKGLKIHYAYSGTIFNVSIVFVVELVCTHTHIFLSFFNFFWNSKIIDIYKLCILLMRWHECLHSPNIIHTYIHIDNIFM